MKPEESVLQLILEAGLLKRVKRSGWWVLGMKDPETVAEHCFRCAILAYAIAKMEGLQEPYRVVMMALFNDIHEARVNDMHKMGQRYVNFKDVEDKAYQAQMDKLPQTMKQELLDLRAEWSEQDTVESHIARDADILECLIQAREYEEQGHKDARRFMQKAPDYLVTKSAQKLWALAQTASIHDWWEKVSIFER